MTSHLSFTTQHQPHTLTISVMRSPLSPAQHEARASNWHCNPHSAFLSPPPTAKAPPSPRAHPPLTTTSRPRRCLATQTAARAERTCVGDHAVDCVLCAPRQAALRRHFKRPCRHTSRRRRRRTLKGGSSGPDFHLGCSRGTEAETWHHLLYLQKLCDCISLRINIGKSCTNNASTPTSSSSTATAIVLHLAPPSRPLTE